jgi:hypothetical protein
VLWLFILLAIVTKASGGVRFGEVAQEALLNLARDGIHRKSKRLEKLPKLCGRKSELTWGFC